MAYKLKILLLSTDRSREPNSNCVDEYTILFLFILQNEARKLNHQELVEEDRRNKLPANWEAKRRAAEWELEEQKKKAVRTGQNSIFFFIISNFCWCSFEVNVIAGKILFCFCDFKGRYFTVNLTQQQIQLCCERWCISPFVNPS